MSLIDQIVFTGELPQSFFDIPKGIYERLPYRPDEEIFNTNRVFQEEAQRNNIVIYTDHQNFRLTGIFPHESNEAYFGYWETTNDAALNEQAFLLLQKDAKDWHRKSITGPLNFNTFHNYRLRLGPVPSWIQFDREPVNPPYYSSLLSSAGFSLKAAFQSRRISKETVPDVYAAKEELIQNLKTIPFHFIPLTPETWAEFSTELYDLVHAIFSANPAYKPISKEQFEILYNSSYALRLCPFSSVLLQEKASGKLAAISMCHPNYKPLQLNGAAMPDFKEHFPMLEKKVLLAKTVGVHPHFRNSGLMNALGAYGMLSFRQHYEEVIFCLMRSDNFSLHFSDNLPYEAAQYALYTKEL